MDNGANKFLEWFGEFAKRVPTEPEIGPAVDVVCDILWNRDWRVWKYKDGLSRRSYLGKLWKLSEIADMADAFLLLDTEDVSC
jgi:hypothetical protein